MKRTVLIVLLAAATLTLVTTVGLYNHLLRRTPGAFAEADGVPVHYAEWGQGEPVILLHGFGVNADINWRLTGVAPALAKQYRVIAMDLRGHGLSGKPHDPDAYGAEMAEDVVPLMDHLGIERAHVAGYSLGGYTALKLATMHPARMRSVACMGAGWLDGEDAQTAEHLASFERFAQQLEAGKGVEPVASGFGEGSHQVTWFHRMQVRFVTSFLGDKLALAALLRGVEGLTVTRAELEAINTPMIAICGDIDPNYGSAQRLHEALPGCELVTLTGRSHPGAVGSPELLTALLDFLRAH